MFMSILAANVGNRNYAVIRGVVAAPRLRDASCYNLSADDDCNSECACGQRCANLNNTSAQQVEIRRCVGGHDNKLAVVGDATESSWRDINSQTCVSLTFIPIWREPAGRQSGYSPARKIYKRCGTAVS